MYVPGDDKRKLNKTLTLDVDCVVMDCEDGVALNKKVSKTVEFETSRVQTNTRIFLRMSPGKRCGKFWTKANRKKAESTTGVSE